MVKALLLSPAYMWFAFLLIVMICVTALFAFIMFIALKPIKTDEFAETTAEKKLKRRETELTVELMKQNDKQKREELIGQLREVKSAEKLVDELLEGDKPAEEAKKAAPAKQVNKPRQGSEVPKKENSPVQPPERQAEKTDSKK